MKKTIVAIDVLIISAILAAIVLALTGASPTFARILTGAAVAGVAARFMLRRPNRAREAGKHFALATRPAEHVGVTFSDVAANEEARASLMGLADYLRDPEKYGRLGARMPRGVMLFGPPGTGKTLLAKALAGEAGVPFFALSGSDFVQMYVGVGAGRVRELFQKARKAGRCVIFIDEIDAMGKRRDEGASDEREQTLNALLSEMSGFHPNDGVIVLAATNRLDTLDPALLRPGRFDRQIEVALPGRAERLSILRLHSRNKPMSDTVDLERLAADTAAFSGASLESLLNEAAIRAAERGADEIGDADVSDAFRVIVAGADKPSVATHAEKCVIALHEAGHALATHLLMPEGALRRVSILPTARGAAGYSLSIPGETAVVGKERLDKQIRVLLAGRAAEQLIAGEDAMTAGASNDLLRATELAGAMAMDLGMEAEPCVSLRALAKTCQTGAQDAPGLCRAALNRNYEAVKELLAAHADELCRLSEALVEREALTGEEVEVLLGAAE